MQLMFWSVPWCGWSNHKVHIEPLDFQHQYNLIYILSGEYARLIRSILYPLICYLLMHYIWPSQDTNWLQMLWWFSRSSSLFLGLLYYIAITSQLEHVVTSQLGNTWLGHGIHNRVGSNLRFRSKIIGGLKLKLYSFYYLVWAPKQCAIMSRWPTLNEVYSVWNIVIH